jgi:hypothetical protein
MKRLIGKTGVKDALLRLDSLTKEASLMAVARILGTIGRVDENVKAVVERTKWLMFPFTYLLTLFSIASQSRNR